MTKRLTIGDIAKRAGVSKTAVSFYLNGKARRYKLSEKTLLNIQRAIEESHFTPNFHARAIILNRTYLVGFILRDSSFCSFWNAILSGVENELRKEDYHLVLGTSGNSIAKERELFEFMRRKGVDGIIYAPALEGGMVADGYPLETGEELPVVSILNPVDGLPSVYTDNVKGGEIAARHLFEMGHSKIAYLGPLCDAPCHPFNARYEGARRFLKRRKIDIVQYADIPAFFESIDKHTAVFCFSDAIAGSLYKECAKGGIRIPDDLSVVGFDNMDFITFFHPDLTTVHQNKVEIGTEAARLVLKGIAGGCGDISSVVFEPMLKAGASVAKLS